MVAALRRRHSPNDVLLLLHNRPVTNLLIEELIHIQADHFCLLSHPQMHERNEFEGVEQDASDDERVRRDGANLSQLTTNLYTNAVHSTLVHGCSIQRRNPSLGEDARKEGSDHATNTVKLEDIHALVDAQPLVDVLAQRADSACDEADEACNPRGDVTGRGGDADKTGDGARASTNKREVALGADVFDEGPAQYAKASGSVGVEYSHHRSDRSVEGRSTVEAEPSEPDEAGTDEDEGGIVGLVVDLVAFVGALAEDEGVCEGRPGDVRL